MRGRAGSLYFFGTRGRFWPCAQSSQAATPPVWREPTNPALSCHLSGRASGTPSNHSCRSPPYFIWSFIFFLHRHPGVPRKSLARHPSPERQRINPFKQPATCDELVPGALPLLSVSSPSLVLTAGARGLQDLGQSNNHRHRRRPMSLSSCIVLEHHGLASSRGERVVDEGECERRERKAQAKVSRNPKEGDGHALDSHCG